MRSALLCFALTLPLAIAAVPSLAETKPDAEQQAALEQARLQLMQNMTYVDEKKCHVAMDGVVEPNSVINLLVAAHSLPNMDKAVVMQALEEAVKRGCDVNERDRAGLPPLAAAVLFNDVTVVRFLLANHADVSQKIERKGSKIDGMDSQQFLNWLLENAAEKGDVRDRSMIQAVLALGK